MASGRVVETRDWRGSIYQDLIPAGTHDATMAHLLDAFVNRAPNIFFFVFCFGFVLFVLCLFVLLFFVFFCVFFVFLFVF